MEDRWEDYFGPGERLIWKGAPQRRWGRFSPVAIGLAIFGLPFLMAGLAVSGGALLYLLGLDIGWAGAAGGLFMFFFGLPFIGVGGGLVFGPLYAMSQAHRKVRYALTNRRAYIATHWWKRKMEVLVIESDAPLTIDDGRTVYFHTRIGTDSDGDRSTEQKGFENIADAHAVYRLIRDIQTDMQGNAT